MTSCRSAGGFYFQIASENKSAVELLGRGLDRKSTRLNSSHRCISYAVFCLKNNATITLTPVTGTDNLEWTGGSTTVIAGTYSVDIQGKAASVTLTYRANCSFSVVAGASRTS